VSLTGKIEKKAPPGCAGGLVSVHFFKAAHESLNTDDLKRRFP
jgi:hypothetical protein